MVTHVEGIVRATNFVFASNDEQKKKLIFIYKAQKQASRKLKDLYGKYNN